MANAAQSASGPVRMMIVGDPGTAKTGALCSLIDAGFKLRILDYDGNLDPIYQFVKDKSKLANVDFLHFEDKMRVGGQFMEPVGIPTAFPRGLAALNRWKYTAADGTEVDLGSSNDWGKDTIVVLDSLTKMGDASFRRAQKLLNKNPTNTTQAVWGLAMAEQLHFIEQLTSKENRFHVIVIAHLRMIAPKEPQKGDSAGVEELKQRVIDLIPTKFYPRALGYELPQTIGGEFPTLIKAEVEIRGRSVKRVLRTVPEANLDLKVPAMELPETLELSTGLLQIFQKLSPDSVAMVQQRRSE